MAVRPTVLQDVPAGGAALDGDAQELPQGLPVSLEESIDGPATRCQATTEARSLIIHEVHVDPVTRSRHLDVAGGVAAVAVCEPLEDSSFSHYEVLQRAVLIAAVPDVHVRRRTG